MLNSKDSARVIRGLANDLVRKDMNTIISTMDVNSKVDFVNGVKTLSEISNAIEKQVVESNDSLVFISAT